VAPIATSSQDVRGLQAVVAEVAAEAPLNRSCRFDEVHAEAAGWLRDVLAGRQIWISWKLSKLKYVATRPERHVGDDDAVDVQTAS
jgi:hypothetical protein